MGSSQLGFGLPLSARGGGERGFDPGCRVAEVSGEQILPAFGSLWVVQWSQRLFPFLAAPGLGSHLTNREPRTRPSRPVPTLIGLGRRKCLKQSAQSTSSVARSVEFKEKTLLALFVKYGQIVELILRKARETNKSQRGNQAAVCEGCGRKALQWKSSSGASRSQQSGACHQTSSWEREAWTTSTSSSEMDRPSQRWKRKSGGKGGFPTCG